MMKRLSRCFTHNDVETIDEKESIYADIYCQD